MSDVTCTRCGAKATGATFEEASSKIDHAIGKSRGIPCGRHYKCVVEVLKDESIHVKTSESTQHVIGESVYAHLDESIELENKPKKSKKEKYTKL